MLRAAAEAADEKAKAAVAEADRAQIEATMNDAGLFQLVRAKLLPGTAEGLLRLSQEAAEALQAALKEADDVEAG